MESLAAAVRHLCLGAVASDCTPGGVVGLTTGAHREVFAFGTSFSAKEGFGSAVERDTIFDMASVTKAMATAAIFMRLCQKRNFSIDTPLAECWPPWACRSETITIRHLLGHASGLPAHVTFFDQIWQGNWSGQNTAPTALLAKLLATPSVQTPGQHAVYSDLGYLVLCFVAQAVANQHFAQLFDDLLAQPLQLSDSFFVTQTHSPIILARIAPTERDGRRGLVRGQVHDENAYIAGGTAGHAGLFSTIDDVLTFGEEIIRGYHGKSRIFSGEITREFLLTRAAQEPTSWRLGWDTPSTTPGVSHAGDKWPRLATVGHLGYTGTSLWLDLDRKLAVAILSNRVHMSRDKEPIKQFRRVVMDACFDYVNAAL